MREEEEKTNQLIVLMIIVFSLLNESNCQNKTVEQVCWCFNAKKASASNSMTHFRLITVLFVFFFFCGTYSSTTSEEDESNLSKD